MHKRILAGITAATIGLFAYIGSPATSGQPLELAGASSSVCATGFRGQPAYDRRCLTTGTRATGAALWFGTPTATRRDVCRGGNVRTMAAETLNDVAYDRYRNHTVVLAGVSDAAQGDCLRLGYADPVSGLVAVNLRSLPKGDCWAEVSYADRKHTKIDTEILCKS